MFKNHIVSAWRYLFKHKVPASINIIGLAIGMACFVLIGLYVFDELSYDMHSPEANRTYRVVTNFMNDAGFEEAEATSPPALMPSIEKNIPGVESITRLFIVNNHKFYVRSEDKKFFEENVYHADSSFFNVFNIRLIEGDLKTGLSDLNAIVISSSTANKYFNRQSAIGKKIEIDDWGAKIVSGVMEDIPENTHFKIDILVPLNRFLESDAVNNWNWYSFYTYVKLLPDVKVPIFEKKVNDIYREQMPEGKNVFFTQPLTSIHLNSHLKYELTVNGDIMYVYILGMVGILILIVASINYINLTTSFSFFRMKEIGVRKIAGASRRTLMLQFIVESILVSVLATSLAMIIVSLCLPAVNQLINKNLQLISEQEWFITVSVLLTGVLIGFASGIYPAYYLSSLRPVKTLKGSLLVKTANVNIRKFFLTVQFVVSIALIFGVIVIMQQVDFVRSARLGLNKDNIIVVNDLFTLSESQRNTLKNEWKNVKGVEEIASSDGILGSLNWSREVKFKGSQNNQRLNFLSVDSDFIKVLKIELKEGKNLSFHSAGDTTDEILLNETAVRDLGIPDPAVGQQIMWRVDDNTKKAYYATIAGVVNDFHFASMREKIKPFAFVVNPKRSWNYTIRLTGSDLNQAIAGLQKVWDQNIKEFPFKYSFLSETFAGFYQSEIRFQAIFKYITAAVIFISCIGLFGLSFLTIHQRNKEIGIRKVLGASVLTITSMLSKDFYRMIIMASFIALPVSWGAIHFWLRDFEYRVNIDFWMFLVTEVIAFVLIGVTILFQVVKAAMANPVKSLKTE